MSEHRDLFTSLSDALANNRFELVIHLLQGAKNSIRPVRMNLVTNATNEFGEVVRKAISGISNTTHFVDYDCLVNPDGREIILTLPRVCVPGMLNIVNNLTNQGDAEPVEITLKRVRGVLVQVLYMHNNERTEALLFFNMTERRIFKPKDRIWAISPCNKVLSPVEEPLIQFGNDALCISIGDTVYVINRISFESLFEYRDELNEQATTILTSPEIVNLFDDPAMFTNEVQDNIQLKRKLAAARGRNNGHTFTPDYFRRVKQDCGGQILYDVSANGKITIDANRRLECVRQIVRVLNGEPASLIGIGSTIFATQQLPIL